MKAALLKAFGSPLAIETLPDPVLGTGEVIVDVAATRVLAYAGDVFSGQRGYLLDLPLVPGAGGVGRVRSIGPDATHLAAGDWVICDPTVRSRDTAPSPDIILQGLTAGSQRALKLQRHFRHGSFAQQTRIPTENAKPIGPIAAADAGRWCALATMHVPYGGFLAGRLQPGETALVNGATGAFGGAGVAMALAMGAGAVIATGRNTPALEALSQRFGPRVRPVRMQGDEEGDRARILDVAAGPIDLVLDLLPPLASPAQVRTALLAVRPGGRVVLMGGLRTEIPIPYDWLMRNGITIAGQWMYPPDATRRLVGLMRAGLLSLDPYEVTEFPLDRANDAVAHAARHAGPFQMTVIRPDAS